MPAALLNLDYSYSICLLLYLQEVRRGARRATHAGHHDDVAGKDLLGHLDSHNPDSEVLPGPVARTRDVDELVIPRPRFLRQTGLSQAGYQRYHSGRAGHR